MAHSHTELDHIIWRKNIPIPDDYDVDDIRQKIIEHPDCYSKQLFCVGNLFSSYFIDDIHQRPDVVLKDFYHDVISEVVTDLGLLNSKFGFNYWCQVYDGDHAIHDHFDPITPLSFVHFIDPIGEYFNFVDSNNNSYYPKQEKGDFIVFPSWAAHRIDVSTGGQRIVVAGNLEFSKFNAVGSANIYTNTVVRKNLFVIEANSKNGAH